MSHSSNQSHIPKAYFVRGLAARVLLQAFKPLWVYKAPEREVEESVCWLMDEPGYANRPLDVRLCCDITNIPYELVREATMRHIRIHLRRSVTPRPLLSFVGLNTAAHLLSARFGKKVKQSDARKLCREKRIRFVVWKGRRDKERVSILLNDLEKYLSSTRILAKAPQISIRDEVLWRLFFGEPRSSIYGSLGVPYVLVRDVLRVHGFGMATLMESPKMGKKGWVWQNDFGGLCHGM